MISADVDAMGERLRTGREVEWQMKAADLGVVRRWLSAHPATDGWLIEARATLEHHDTYFDTDDWRIFRSGFALRVRNESGAFEATFKELRSVGAELADRRELTEPMAEAGHDVLRSLAGPVGTRIHAVAGSQPLHALFAAHTSKQRFGVRREGATADLGEIALDETVISRPNGALQASLQRVEVEALTAEREHIEGLVKVLRRECALASETDSKYVVGLRSVGLAPPAVPQFGSRLVDGAMRIDEIAMAALRGNLSLWLENEPGARLGEEPEELHDLRIAGRRIDAALNLFAAFLPVALVRMRPRLKMLLHSLGTVRDLDIELCQLEKLEPELAGSDRQAVAPLKRHLELERRRARARMLRILDAPGTQRWLERLKLALVQSSVSRRRRSQPLATAVMPALIRSRYRRVRKAADRLTAESSMEEYHAVRGKLKKLRYAIESVAAIYGRPAEQFLRSLRRLQDRLGQQQDAHVAHVRLRALARQPHKAFPAETIFLMGSMAERHAAAADRARMGFGKAYRPVHRKGWRRLRRKLDGLNTQASSSPEAEKGNPQSIP